MDDDDVNVNIKPGVFTIPSKITDFGPTYEGLHSDDSVSVSYVEEEIEDNGTLSSSSLSSNFSNKNSKKKIIIKKKNSKMNLKEVPYTFTWDEGGKNIKVTGTFGKWSKFYDMKYFSKEKLFKCTINLPRDKHEYKFIVDGNWKYSKKQPLKKDNKNNTNNIIDLTNYIPKDMQKNISIEKVQEKAIKIKEKPKKRKKIQRIKNDDFKISFWTSTLERRLFI